MDLLTEFPWITLAAGSMWPGVGCGDCGKYFYIVTFHLMSRTGMGMPGEPFPVGRLYLIFTGSSWHQLSIISKPLSLSSLDLCQCRSTPGRGTTPAPLLVFSGLVPHSLGTLLISGLLLITLSFLGNGTSSCWGDFSPEIS